MPLFSSSGETPAMAESVERSKEQHSERPPTATTSSSTTSTSSVYILAQLRNTASDKDQLNNTNTTTTTTSGGTQATDANDLQRSDDEHNYTRPTEDRAAARSNTTPTSNGYRPPQRRNGCADSKTDSTSSDTDCTDTSPTDANSTEASAIKSSATAWQPRPSSSHRSRASKTSERIWRERYSLCITAFSPSTSSTKTIYVYGTDCTLEINLPLSFEEIANSFLKLRTQDSPNDASLIADLRITIAISSSAPAKWRSQTVERKISTAEAPEAPIQRRKSEYKFDFGPRTASDEPYSKQVPGAIYRHWDAGRKYRAFIIGARDDENETVQEIGIYSNNNTGLAKVPPSEHWQYLSVESRYHKGTFENQRPGEPWLKLDVVNRYTQLTRDTMIANVVEWHTRSMDVEDLLWVGWLDEESTKIVVEKFRRHR